MDKFFKKIPKVSIDSTSQEPRQIESNSAQQEPPSDPGLRLPIFQYNPNEQDRICHSYLIKKPIQPYNHNFSQRDIGGKMRRFNKDWFNQYNTLLEYSVEKDAAFCLCCYLFRLDYVGSGGRTIFVGEGYKNWKSKKGFDEHVGDSNSLHNQAYRMCMNLMNQNQSIQTVLDRHSVKEDMDYRVQLNVTVDTIRLLLRPGLAFCGHDESENSNNPGNFLEFMRFLGDHNKEIDKVILNKASQNLKLIAPSIQKDIVNAYAEEAIKEVIAKLGDEWFSVLVDESRDVSVKEQMAVVIRFVNKGGYVVQRFLGIVHGPNTTSLELKAALESLFAKYGLTFSRLRGQGYDGTSNMRGESNGLKKLIMRKNRSAYYMHCFAHQLQLTPKQ